MLVKDHVIPLYQGGSDGVDNIQPLCVECNSSKGAEDFHWLAYRKGMEVIQGWWILTINDLPKTTEQRARNRQRVERLLETQAAALRAIAE